MIISKGQEGASTLFTYKRGNQYYIEQPYNGCYPISEEEFQQIMRHLIENSGDTAPLALLAESVSYADGQVKWKNLFV